MFVYIQHTVCVIHFSKGSILQDHGKVELLADIVIIRIDIKPVFDTESSLKNVSGILDEALAKTQDTMLRNTLKSIVRHQRLKRSLLPFVGAVLKSFWSSHRRGLKSAK